MEQDLIKQRIDEAYVAMEKNLMTSMYADGVEGRIRHKKSIRERLSDWKWRIQGAWLVLRGRADIC